MGLDPELARMAALLQDPEALSKLPPDEARDLMSKSRSIMSKLNAQESSDGPTPATPLVEVFRALQWQRPRVRVSLWPCRVTFTHTCWCHHPAFPCS